MVALSDITPVLSAEQVARIDPKYLDGDQKPPVISGTLQNKRIFPHGETRRYTLSAGTVAANVGLAAGDAADDAYRLALVAEDLMQKPVLRLEPTK